MGVDSPGRSAHAGCCSSRCSPFLRKGYILIVRALWPLMNFNVVGLGSVVYAPAEVKHSLATHGDKPMRFIFFYPAVNVQRQWITQ